MKSFNSVVLGSIVMVGATMSNISSIERAGLTEPTCKLVTSTQFGINTVIENPAQWLKSINSKYYRGDHTWSDSVPAFTASHTRDSNVITAIGYVASGILEAEGYKVTSSVVTVSSCDTSSSSNSDETCHLSNNDGNCEGDGTNPGKDECVAHNDHWHCPVGVSPPSDHPGRPGLFTSQNAGSTSSLATVVSGTLLGVALAAVMCL